MAESSFKMVTLGDLIDSDVIRITTGFPFGGHNADGDGVPHIRPFNVGTDGEIHLEQIKYIPAAAAAGRPTLQRNDIVFNNTNTKELVGKCALWSSDEQPVFSNHMTRIRVVDDSCDPAYLSFAILQHWTNGNSEMLARSHVAQASVIGSRFREIEVPWPDYAAQRDIGRLIQWVRVACQSEAAQLAHAKALKDAVMTKLFTLGLRGQPQNDTAIGPIPESWAVVPLGSLGRIGNGSTPKKTVSAYWHGGTFPWLTSAKVYDREIEFADQFVSDVARTECHLPRLRPGAVLMAITGQGKTLGHCAVLKIEATVSQHVAYLQTDTDKVDPSFVRGYLETQYEYLRQVAAGGGSTKGALTCAFLRGLPVPLPSKDEQLEIVAVLDGVDRKIDLHHRKYEAFEDLFKAMLHKLMTSAISLSELAIPMLPSVSTQREEATA